MALVLYAHRKHTQNATLFILAATSGSDGNYGTYSLPAEKKERERDACIALRPHLGKREGLFFGAQYSCIQES